MTDLSKMNELINKLADEPFKYGKNDCYTFTAALVKEWHGKDYTKHHAVYKSKKEAIKYMYEFNGIESLTVGTLGYPVAAEHCEDGDVVLAEVGPDGLALGFVFNGHGLFKTKKKPVKVPLNKCLKGWRIR
jgi:hypothetical protein